MTTETARIVVKADTSGVNKLSDALKRLQERSKTAGSNVFKFEKATEKLNKSFKIQKNAVQQSAFQIQDFAVQVGAGTSAVQAFNQQAPQLLGIFGAGGAVLGGVIAVAGAIGGPFLMSLLDSKDAIDEMDESMEKLNETIKINADGTLTLTQQYERFAAVSDNVANVQLKVGMVSAAKATTLAFKALGEELEAFDLGDGETGGRSLAGKFKGIARELGVATPEAKALSEALSKALNDKTLESAESLEATMAGIAVNSGKVTDEFTELAAKTSAVVLAIRDQTAATKELKAVESGLGVSDPFGGQNPLLDGDFSQRQFEQSERAEERAEALSQRKGDRIRREMALKHRQADQEEAIERARILSTANFYASSIAIIGQGQNETNAIYKIGLAAQKAAAIPSIITSTQQASLAAIALAGGNVAAGIPVQLLGAAAVGTVAGQAIASFDGGGFTGSGSRTGGVDGRGGFNAVLHPNETVIDHTKGQGMAPKIEVYNYSGQQARVLTEGDVTRIVVGQMSNANSEGRRGLVQTSNVQNRGVR